METIEILIQPPPEKESPVTKQNSEEIVPPKFIETHAFSKYDTMSYQELEKSMHSITPANNPQEFGYIIKLMNKYIEKSKDPLAKYEIMTQSELENEVKKLDLSKPENLKLYNHIGTLLVKKVEEKKARLQEREDISEKNI